MSRIHFKDPQEPPINDSLRDDMIYGINRSDPWYADIVNYMVSSYVPPGANKKNLIQESRSHIWDEPYLFRVCSDGLLRRCVTTEEGWKIIDRCHHHHMEVIMEHLVHIQRSSSVDSTGLQCMKTRSNISEDVGHVKGTET